MSGRSLRERLFGGARGLDKNLLPFMGPAQVGAGHPEEPYRLPDDPRCPICGGPMALHALDRSADPSRPTRMICPPRDTWDDAA
ncbi:hypothetical protein [Amnibacterium kyonggiense]|uniref:Uncharacterized protein n=1 Tax=Amnibacterium kyonggiense TaxID=595671 RepID=A0A4R7FHP6_9MICO|nr:hypothetical protein [Amnibacterium kyonggiense]TDS75834.1 hypothetical protein CLV52_2943 [Amnibacterium kyonggiense]